MVCRKEAGTVIPLLPIALSLWGIHLHFAFALHLPQLCLQLIHGIQAGPANPAGARGMQGCWQSWHGQDPGVCLPSCGQPFTCLVIVQSDRVLYHDELLCFSAGAITTDFCAVEETLRLTAWDLSAQAGAWSRDTGNSALLEAVCFQQLCLSCCGFQQPMVLGLLLTDSLERVIPPSGTQPRAYRRPGTDSISCWHCLQSVGCCLGSLTTEIFGSGTPRFLQDV